MGLLKNIYWDDDSKNTIVHRVDINNDYVAKGSNLTVRESQAAVFCHQGKMADVFPPGRYKLDSDSIPFLTKLMSWKYGFENPFRSDIYFVNTKQFTNEKWGTITPILLRDKDYGAIRVRGHGTYSFKVDDPFIFMQELSGTNSSFKTQEITEYLRSMVLMGITDALGESKTGVLDMAANLMELSKEVEANLTEDFKNIGLKLVKFVFQSFSLPDELQKILDESTGLGMLRGNMDVYALKKQADAIGDAARNPGMAGTVMGAGMGMGMGMGMGSMMGSMMNPQNMAQNVTQVTAKGSGDGAKCNHCGANVKANAKFCPECGKSIGESCPKCKAAVKAGSKFCPECGEKLGAKKCGKCGADVKAGVKFCPECGEKQ